MSVFKGWYRDEKVDCLVQCDSRFLTDEETCYATIELELLAVAWAMSKCRHYLIGLPNFPLMMDHRPLIPILNSYTLNAVENPRLQRLKEKVSQYVFTAIWHHGKTLSIPDTLSRAQVSRPAVKDETLCKDTATNLRCVFISVVTLGSPESTCQEAEWNFQELLQNLVASLKS